MTLDYAFTALSLHNVILRVNASNERGVKAYERAGFKLIGRRRQSRVRGGVAEDTILMDCLATEFKSPVLRKLVGLE